MYDVHRHVEHNESVLLALLCRPRQLREVPSIPRSYWGVLGEWIYRQAPLFILFVVVITANVGAWKRRISDGWREGISNRKRDTEKGKT